MVSLFLDIEWRKRARADDIFLSRFNRRGSFIVNATYPSWINGTVSSLFTFDSLTNKRTT